MTARIEWPSDTPQTLGALLRWQASRNGARELLSFGATRLTVADVECRANQVAAFLRRAGVAPGDRVGVMLPNGLEFPVCWLAIATVGAIMVPINVQYRAHDLAYTLHDSGASVLLADPAFEQEARAAMPRCPALRQLHLFPPGTVTSRSAGPVAAAIHDAPVRCELHPSAPGDLLNLQYTSGTTGSPKGCMLSHAYWARLAVQSARYAQLGPDDVALTAQPFYYMDPQWNLAMALLVGCRLEILPRFSASTFWSSVRDTGASFVYLLGTMPVLLLKQPPRPEVERGHRLRVVACSGIVPALHAEFESRWGVPWREVFGMTETGIDLAIALDEGDSVGSGAVGRPVAGREARVVAPDGRALGDGEVGELCVRGEGMMAGYWNNPAATADRLRDGWMHTGDLAYRDARGRYHLVGRIKDMIRRGGENIAAAEVEGVLAQHPAVRTAAAVPVPDDLRGEEVKAFLELQPGHEATDPREILAFARAHLAPFKVPRFVEYVPALPRTPSEKIAKHQLLADRDDQRRGAFDATTGTWA